MPHTAQSDTAQIPSRAHPKDLIYSDLTELITDTPLLTIRRVGGDAPRATVLAKMEHVNPGGSVKDRIALAMITAAERAGVLKQGGTVIEPTSGNTGIGLALVCRRKGYRCILTMPASMSLERRQLLAAYGAEVELTAAEDQMAGAMAKAEQLLQEIPGSFCPRQFENEQNPLTHYQTTAEEILFALEGTPVDAFVAAVGTGGTVSGVGRRLKELYPQCRVIAVEPESCATISRGERGPSKIQGIAAGFVPANYDSSIVDEVRTVTDQQAYEAKRQIGRLEGVLVGISSGANLKVAMDVAAELGTGKTVVTVFCDTGERYFSLDQHFKDQNSGQP